MISPRLQAEVLDTSAAVGVWKVAGRGWKIRPSSRPRREQVCQKPWQQLQERHRVESVGGPHRRRESLTAEALSLEMEESNGSSGKLCYTKCVKC